MNTVRFKEASEKSSKTKKSRANSIEIHTMHGRAEVKEAPTILVNSESNRRLSSKGAKTNTENRTTTKEPGATVNTVVKQDARGGTKPTAKPTTKESKAVRTAGSYGLNVGPDLSKNSPSNSGSNLGDYRMLPDHNESQLNSKASKELKSGEVGKASPTGSKVPTTSESGPRQLLHIAQEEEVVNPRYRIIEYDENLQEFRKIDVINP
ncbi:uncharacterized protein LOC134848209 [Symsagittifera roscoffensis]|uniref:uncharacterized protein LOC134848209 n=1 Tax=Symsagittifera roscoffensis TaxID=84072 RepID=UPI00307C073D